MKADFLKWLFMREPTLLDKSRIDKLAQEIFRKLDINNDKRISKTEFSDTIATFDSFDSNGDGYIDKAELYGDHRKRICVVLVNRSNYGRLKPVMELLDQHENVDLQIVSAGSMLLEKYGKAMKLLTMDGFHIDDEALIELDGSTVEAMAKSTGLAIIDFASIFKRLEPDFALLIGDRFETLGAAIAAAYQNICIIHVQGGEISGSIDESIRHAITKFSHYHFVATKKAARNVERMGEPSDTIFAYGCPSIDIVEKFKNYPLNENLNELGVGWEIDFSEPYFLVVFHSVTTEIDKMQIQMRDLLKALGSLYDGKYVQSILLWPNIDAGNEIIAKEIRMWREMSRLPKLHGFKHLPVEQFIPLLNNATVAIGNSSSLIRDASFLGTPIVLIGSRQDGREHTDAVIQVSNNYTLITEAIKEQMKHGRYMPSDLYGKEGTSQRIVNKILELKPYIQKRLNYE